jgi:hypothetical protein
MSELRTDLPESADEGFLEIKRLRAKLGLAELALRRCQRLARLKNSYQTNLAIDVLCDDALRELRHHNVGEGIT